MITSRETFSLEEDGDDDGLHVVTLEFDQGRPGHTSMTPQGPMTLRMLIEILKGTADEGTRDDFVVIVGDVPAGFPVINVCEKAAHTGGKAFPGFIVIGSTPECPVIGGPEGGDQSE